MILQGLSALTLREYASFLQACSWNLVQTWSSQGDTHDTRCQAQVYFPKPKSLRGKSNLAYTGKRLRRKQMHQAKKGDEWLRRSSSELCLPTHYGHCLQSENTHIKRNSRCSPYMGSGLKGVLNILKNIYNHISICKMKPRSIRAGPCAAGELCFIQDQLCFEFYLADVPWNTVGSYEEAEEHNQLPPAETGQEYEEAVTAVGTWYSLPWSNLTAKHT